MRLSAENAGVDRYNAEKLSKIGNPITRIVAINSSSRGSSMTSDNFRGLKNSLYLAVEAQVNLTFNFGRTSG